MNTEALPTQIGKYRVRRLLGSGGMGRVYLAEDPDIGREVAIKRVTLGKDPQARERFLREAQTMGRLNHPNIVTLLEYGVDQQAPFLVLELLSGTDLSHWMRQPQTLHDQVRVLLGIAEAIAAAHRVGVLHRDLKPDNVRVLEDGRCKLLDFGIAQSGAAALTATGYFVGTPEYVAPEVMLGASHTAAADVYALGLLGYTLLVGSNPFCGETVQTTVARVLAVQAAPLATRVRSVPVALMTLIERCLSRTPEERPESAEAMVLELRRILAGIDPATCVERIAAPAETARLPIRDAATRSTANATPPPARAGRSLRSLAPVLLALGVGVGATLWLLRPAPPEPAAAIAPGPVTSPPATVAASPAPPPATGVDDAPADPAAPPAETRTAPPEIRSTQIEPSVTPSRTTVTEPVATAPSTRLQPVPPAEVQSATPEPAAPLPAVAPPAVPPAPPTQPESAAAPSTGATAPAVQTPPEPAPITLAIRRYSPRVIRAGRSVTVRIEGEGLAAVTAALIGSGGTADARFRIGALRHSGNSLEFPLSVARGVPLGRYPLLLQGPNVRAEPLILEVSL